MKFSSRVLVSLAAAALALALLPVRSDAGAVEPAMVAVVSPASREDSLSRSALRAMFGMRLHKWPDGTSVKVYVLRDDAPEHAQFCKELLQVFPHQLRQAWDRQVFSGLSQYPEQVSSVQEMLSKVKSSPGAVGYVRSNEVSQDVRILQIR